MEHNSHFDDPDTLSDETRPPQNPPNLPVTPTPRRNRSLLALAATLALVALAGALFASLAARHGGPGGLAKATPTLSGRHAQASPQPTAVPINSQTGLPLNLELSSVQMFSANDGWAVGTIQRPGSSNSGEQGAILHCSTGRWRQVGPLFPSAALASIAMLSDTEDWVVGCSSNSSGASQIVILHSHNSVWSVVPLHVGGCLSSISMLSADEGWAVGSSNIGKADSLILHYTDGDWTSIPTTIHALQAISMISSSEGLFVGNDGTIGQYQNGVWSQWPQGAIGTLVAVQMLSASDGWAVGSEAVLLPSGEMGSLAYIMRYGGSSWQQVSAPGDLGHQAQLSGLAMVSPTQGWAVSATVSNTGPNGTCMILQYQNGAWRNTHIPYAGQLNSVSMVSANEGWAVGYSYNSDYTAVNALLLHYHNGIWSVYSA